MQTDIRIMHHETSYQALQLRTPFKLGKGTMDSLTCATVTLEVENRAGRRATGKGSVLLAGTWAWPGPEPDPAAKDQAMRQAARDYASVLAAEDRFQHPLMLSAEAPLSGAMPPLAAAVAASAADAALHDAFGKVNAISSWDGLGPEHMSHDLSALLGARFRGRYPVDYLRKEPLETVPVFHTVGASDKLTRGEVDGADPDDGLPNCLVDWIARDGVYCFKIKLTGDPRWDMQRTSAVARVGGEHAVLLADCNESYQSLEALTEYLRLLQVEAPDAFGRLTLVEQPFRRGDDIRVPALSKPVFADESVALAEDVQRLFADGYSGIMLKTCRRHSQVLLHIALAHEAGRPYSVQDLTHTGAALLHNASLAARTCGLRGFEYNSRQYLPDHAPLPVNGGVVQTGGIPALGLGA